MVWSLHRDTQLYHWTTIQNPEVTYKLILSCLFNGTETQLLFQYIKITIIKLKI